jgi:hypothetical protein
MGWNSYDAFGDTVTESEVMANANYLKEKLQSHGWKYIVIDFRWYDPDPPGNDFVLNQRRTGARLAADAFGRMVPAENRFPSSAGGKGFKPVADKLHDMGLKFGFHWDLSLLTSDEVLALDQDPAVKPAARLGSSGAVPARTEVWLRELKDGSRVAGLFNRGETPEQATLMWGQAGLNGKWSVRDLWQRKDLGAFEGQFSAQVPAHGAVLLRAARSTATTQ